MKMKMVKVVVVDETYFCSYCFDVFVVVAEEHLVVGAVEENMVNSIYFFQFEFLVKNYLEVSKDLQLLLEDRYYYYSHDGLRQGDRHHHRYYCYAHQES